MGKNIKSKILVSILLFTVFNLFSVYANALITLNSSNEQVLMIQERLIDLQYYSFMPTGTFGGMTRQSIIYFQSVHGIMADGSVGDESIQKLFSNSAQRAPIPANVRMPIGPAAAVGASPANLGSDANWFDEISQKMKLETSYKLTDVITQKSFSIQRVAGVNHAKVEVSTKEDNNAFLEIFGNEYNWSKRPVVISIENKLYAASLQGIPSGDDFIPNNDMEGNCTLYFSGSLSDMFSLPDVEHNANVLKASDIENWS